MDLEPLKKLLERALDEDDELRLFLRLAHSGLTAAEKATADPKLQNKYHDAIPGVCEDPGLLEILQESCRRAAPVIEKWAIEQAKYGHPYLYGLACVRLWGILESMIEDFVLAVLHQPDLLPKKGVLYEIKGPLVPFLFASNQERADQLYFELTKGRMGRKPGLAGFEYLMDAIGLKGDAGIPAEIRRAMKEIAAVRNVIVHRNMVADSKFAEACPWSFKNGERVNLSWGDFILYSRAIAWYVLELTHRLKKKWEEDYKDWIGPRNEELRGVKELLAKRSKKTAIPPCPKRTHKKKSKNG